MKEMEAERNAVKSKIATWKKHFEKRYKRPPSDEEKLRNIPELFQRFSYVSTLCLVNSIYSHRDFLHILLTVYIES